MNPHVALVVYGSTVAGEASDSVDIQVRLFRAASIESVERAIRSEPRHEYENGVGELVTWSLAAILDIQPLAFDIADGTEVAGAITSLNQIALHLPQSAV